MARAYRLPGRVQLPCKVRLSAMTQEMTQDVSHRMSQSIMTLTEQSTERFPGKQIFICRKVLLESGDLQRFVLTLTELILSIVLL